MSLTELAIEFRNQAQNNSGNITVNADSFTKAGLSTPADLDVKLQAGYKLAAGSNLLINTTGTTINDPVGNTLTITGVADVLNVAAANTAVSFVITDDGSGNASFVIVITLSNWTFSTSWKFMTGGVFAALPYTAPAFIFSSEAESTYRWLNNDIALVAGQNFACLITLTGILQQVINFLTSWSGGNLALTGKLDPSLVNDDDIIYPDLDLKVKLNVTPIQLGFLKVKSPSVGFRIDTYSQEIDVEDIEAEDGEDGTEIALYAASVGDDPEFVIEQETSLYFQLELLLGADIIMDFNTIIIPESKAFDLGVSSNPQKTLTPLNLFTLMAGNNWYSILPVTLQQYLNKIAFRGFAASLDFKNGLSINSVSAAIGSNGTWKLFQNFEITDFEVQWLILGPGSINSQSVFLTASVNFFPDIFKGGFDVEITSDLTLSADFVGTVDFSALLSGITGGIISIPSSIATVVFTGFGMSMDINNRYYSFYASTDINIDFITNISVTNGSLEITSSAPVTDEGDSVFTAAVSGLFAIGDLELDVAVDYNSSKEDGGWNLSIAMPDGDDLDLGQLMKQLFNAISLPSSFLPDDLKITQFSLTSFIPNADGAESSYEVKTGLAWKFTFPIINQRIEIIAKLWLKYETESGKPGEYSGGVMGSILLDYFNAEVNIGYNFSKNNQLLLIEWEGITAEYNIAAAERTIKFSVKNWSLGSLLTSFMKMLFDPTFELDAPWDILNKISLDGFSVTYNLDTYEVKVNYPLPKSLNLVFITINGINLTKNETGVFISFDGTSPIPSINDSNLFKPGQGQDVKKMPEVPGQGNQYFDLRLLAMGQHVSLTDPAQYQSIKQVTDAMQAAFTEPKPGKLPVGPTSGNSLLNFDEDSNWLIATNFGILNVAGKGKTPIWTVDMQVVFNDPNLYGLYIGLNGEKAKVLAGLKFEIMYKKISDSIGVYQIDLTLPNALRNLQFGAVNVTLPSISLDIYTNGDFMVDIGFPYNMDFSRSFTLQAIVPPGIPAMGSGGFYFGKLSSATTNKVPATNYGNFNPVIVFGIGLQVGVGYSVNYGILSAGFSLTLFGIIEGVIAAYHPYSGALSESNPQAVETSYYYYLQGTIGIIGKLYGSIDFGIISASVNITIMIYVQATFEAYNKIPLSIVASVEVRVSAKLNLGIFSITIHFSFTAKIRQDLTIGTDNTSKAPWNNDLGAPKQMRVSASEPMVLGGLMSKKVSTRKLNYQVVLTPLATEDLPVLNLYFVPHLTIAGPENGNLSAQQAQYVATLFIDAPNADGTTSANGTTSFEYLCTDFFRWLIQNYVDPVSKEATRATAGAQGISKEDLDELVALLSNEDNPFPIPTDQLINFLKTSFKEVNIQALTQDLPSAAIFPMFFDIALSVPDISLDIDFSNYNMATTDYLKAVKEWFAELAVQVQEEGEAPNLKNAAGDPTSYSMSTFVFEDYFVLIGKQLAGYASDAMDNFTYQLDNNVNGNSLADMATWANGITVNGKSNIVTIADIATANQNHPLNAGVQIAITGNMHPVASGDNFLSIAAIYAITPSMLIQQSGTVPNILAPQKLQFNGNSYDVVAGDTLEKAAAGLNTTLPVLAADPNFQKTAVLTDGGMLIVSAAVYSAKNEDTFNSVANDIYKTFSPQSLLMQNQIVPGLFIAGKQLVFSGKTYDIVPGDTLKSIAEGASELTKTVITVEDLSNDPQIQASNIQPLGLALIPPFNYTTVAFEKSADADTLATLASKYNTTPALMGSNFANQQLSNLFYSTETKTSNIPGLQYLDVDSILQYFVANNSYGQLSGMASRYQLHGMRLPTNLPGLTLSEGSPCTADGSCALFSLTGQQFALPANVAAGFTIELVNKSLDWLLFDGKKITDPDGGTLKVALTAEDVTQISTLLTYAQTQGIKPEISKLAPMRPYDLLPLQYTFQTATKWQSSGALALPYTTPTSNDDVVSPIIWAFPSGMLQQISLPKVAGSKFDIQIGQYDAANGMMNYNPSSSYGWNTMVEIEVKRLEGASTAAVNAYTYELMGADEAGALLLQKLLMALTPNANNNNSNLISDIQWLYEGDDGLLSVGMANMKSFIVQANLSTETNPKLSFKAMALLEEEEQANTGILNSTYDFVRMLWECSITRSGGYYLLYNETEADKGFPDSIFGKGDTATIRLMVTYTDQYNNIPADYMNCAVTGDKIDVTSCVVYAESAVQKGLVANIENSTDTLATVTLKYNILLSELAELNKDVVLNTKVAPLPVIVLEGLIYETGTVGLPNSLDTIVSYFGVAAADVQRMNPGITDWTSLPLWQIINIPTVNYTVTDAPGTAGNKLSSIMAYYFIDMPTLAWAAKNVTNLFTVPTALTVNDQILHKVSSVSQGSAGFELQRASVNTTESSKVTDSDYAKNYLDNLYNLLSYQIVDNAWFEKSIVGLPAGPATPQTKEDMLGLSDAPDDDAPWIYNQVIPISKYAKPNSFMKYEIGYPDEEHNIYRGIGNYVQVHFDWVDYYGNNTVTPFSDPALEPTAPLNNPPNAIGYTDELKGFAKWPSLEMSYWYKLQSTDVRDLILVFNFNNKRYVPIPDVPDDQQQDWRKNASNDLIIYTNIYYQLTQLNPVTGANTLTVTLASTLTPGNNVSIDPSKEMLDFVKNVYTYLNAIMVAVDGTAAAGIPVPVMPSITTTVDVATVNTASILQLAVSVDFVRDLSFVNTDFRDSALVTHALSVVKPVTSIAAATQANVNTAAQNEEQYGLNGFADAFEDAFLSAGNYVLKIATGTNSVLAGSNSSQAIFVVRMGLKSGQGIYWQVTEAGAYELTTSSIANLTSVGVPEAVTTALATLTGTMYNDRDAFDVALQAALTADQFTTYRVTIYTYSLLNPVFYSPKPLATSLISKNNVPVCRYVTGKGLDCTGNNIQNFTGIDMDNWGSQSLNAIDTFLTSDYSVPAFLVDQLKATDEKAWLAAEGIAATSFLEAVTTAKKTLANVISNEVAPILTAPYVADAGPSLENARKQFEQQLLNQLGNAYNINALVQMQVTAQSDFTPTGNMLTPPRLYGAPSIKKSKGANGQAADESDNSEYSLSTSKVQLNEKGVDTDAYLTFTFSTKNAKDAKNVSLDLSYVVTHIEFEITDVPGIEGYQGSNWLTFIIPATVDNSISNDPAIDILQQDLGTLDIPVVLRNYPTAPTLTTQIGNSTEVDGTNTKEILEKASEWNYTYAYSKSQVAQDKIFSEIEFNLIPADQLAMFKSSSRDLFSDMAQLMMVWPQLLQDFNKYLTAINVDTTAADPNLANAYYALQTFVLLINNLSIAWSEYGGTIVKNPNAGATRRVYDFMVEQSNDIPNGERLLITIVPQQDLPPQDLNYFRNGTIVQNVDIPVQPYVTIEGYDITPATNKNGVIPNAYWYLTQGKNPTYLTWEGAKDIASMTLNIDELNVLQFQYAWAGLAVIRNEDLIPFNPTVNDFIYRTPLVKFSNKLIPLLTNDDIIDISKLNTTVNQTLAQQLSKFFETFFFYDELKEQFTKLSVTWNYPLVNDPQSLMPAIQLPILLATPFDFTIPADYEIPDGGCSSTFSESDPFVCRLSSAIKEWFSQQNPVTTNAWLKLDLSVFSSLSESKLPLIDLKKVILFYSNITDMPPKPV